MTDEDKQRRAFVRAENVKLGRFLSDDRVVRWSRSYKCTCGFACFSPGEIWDHSLVCKANA